MATESLFGASPTIGFADNAEDVYSMATRITFAVAGVVSGIRRWGTTNAPAGAPQATIYSTAGVQLLTPVNFPAHTPSAWNTVTGLSFAVSAGQTLDVTAGPLSRYAGNSGTFASPLVVGNLTGTAGRFIASATLAATNTTSTAWFGIDVLFDADTGITGALAATLPPLTAAASGVVVPFGPLAATLPALTAAFTNLSPTRATSTATVTAGRTSTAAVTARRASAPTVAGG